MVGSKIGGWGMLHVFVGGFAGVASSLGMLVQEGTAQIKTQVLIKNFARAFTCWSIFNIQLSIFPMLCTLTLSVPTLSS